MHHAPSSQLSLLKKTLRVVAMVLVSLLLLIALCAGLAIAYVFQPNRLSQLVNRYANDYLTATCQVGRIEPVFFSTFPQFGLQLDSLLILNPMEGAACDTLLSIDKLVAKANLGAWLKNREWLLDEFVMTSPRLYLYTDSCGQSNYQIFPTSSDSASSETSDSGLFPYELQLRDIRICDGTIDYIDCSQRLVAQLHSLNFSTKLRLHNQVATGRLEGASPKVTCRYDGTDFLRQQALACSFPFEVDLHQYRINLSDAFVALSDAKLQFEGKVSKCEQGWLTDIRFEQKEASLQSYLDLIPSAYSSLIEGYDMGGFFQYQGHVHGVYTDSTLPLADLEVLVKQTHFSSSDFPDVALDNLQASVSAHLNLTDKASSHLRLNQLDVQVNRSSHLAATAQLSDLFSENMEVDASLQLQAKSSDWNSFFPDGLTIDKRTRLEASLQTHFQFDRLMSGDWSGTTFESSIRLTEGHIQYDTLEVTMPSLAMGLSWKPGNRPARLCIEHCPSLAIRMGNQLQAALTQVSGEIALSDFLNQSEKASLPHADLQLNLGSLLVDMDDELHIDLAAPVLTASLKGQQKHPSLLEASIAYQGNWADVTYQGNKLQAAQHRLSAQVTEDNRHEAFLLRWNPRVSLELLAGRVGLDHFEEDIQLPHLSMDYNNECFDIRESHVLLGHSDFHLSGQLSHIDKFLAKEDLLTGELEFVSNKTDVNQLMSLVSGLGSDSTEVNQDNLSVDSTTNDVPQPFLVPKRVDLSLKTTIKEAEIGEQIVTNLGGNLFIRDGEMILEEMGFICQAAKLNLTAIYRSPRPNHLYVGLDYHMVDIHIEELLGMIPQIDSVLPMLRSFKGQGEFHIAAETNLNARYELKKSTLRGAASISGKDLVLLDGEQFSEIAKLLMFNKKTENRIDSINAEMTVFRNEVDIYPFQVSMDKYKAILAGRHNLDMSFDYHISLVSPLSLGVNVTGRIGDLKIRPAACQYTDQYRPSSRRLLEQQQLNLRTIIRESLRKEL